MTQGVISLKTGPETGPERDTPTLKYPATESQLRTFSEHRTLSTHTYIQFYLLFYCLVTLSYKWLNFAVLYSLPSRYLLPWVALYLQQTVLLYCFPVYLLDMLTNVAHSKDPCRTLPVTFSPSYRFMFVPKLYLVTSYLSMPEPSKLCNGYLWSFKAFGKSFCQKLSRYPSELCHLGYIYPCSMTELCRELQEVCKTKCHITEVILTLPNRFYLSTCPLIVAFHIPQIPCGGWGASLLNEKNNIGVNQLYLTANYWQYLQVLTLADFLEE